MINDKNIANLRNAASDYRVSPSDKAWERLEGRLKDNQYKYRISQYKIALIAAIFVMTLAVVALVHNMVNIQKGKEFSDARHYTSESIQPLSASSDAMYRLEHINELKSAYNRLGMSSKG